jgi:hypothetical protein
MIPPSHDSIEDYFMPECEHFKRTLAAGQNLVTKIKANILWIRAVVEAM